MIYELRFYEVTRGRMADQNGRITRHLPALFARHGVRCVGAWNALAGPRWPRFVYMLAFDDFAHRERAWGGFYVDPDWARVRAETNAGHEMVERHDLYFLKPNATWQPPAGWPAPAGGEVHELVLQQLAPGQAAGANAFLRDTYLPAMHEAGARTLGIFDMVSGPGMQQVLMLHAWRDAGAWAAGRAGVEAAPAVLAALARQRQQLGQAIFGRAEVNLLAAVPGVPAVPESGT